MAVHQNYITGAGPKPASRRPILTPRTCPMWSANTRGRTRRRCAPPSRRHARRFPRGRAAACRRAPTCSTRSATRSSRARTSSARCSRARRARPGPKASAKRCARAISSSSLPARWCARPAKCCRRCGPASRWKSRASRWAWSASSRRGISRSRSRRGRSRPRSPTATASCSSRRTSCPGCAWALAEIIARAGVPAGVFNLVMGRGSVRRRTALEQRR